MKLLHILNNFRFITHGILFLHMANCSPHLAGDWREDQRKHYMCRINFPHLRKGAQKLRKKNMFFSSELYEPFSVEFINWLFKHLHKDKCSKEFIDQVLEPECVKKLYSDMFQSSGSYTDDLFFETAVIASEIDHGIPLKKA